MSFSAPLQGARVTSLCLAKEKLPRERPPREHVLSTSVCSGCASGRRGSPKAHPCACGELAHILCAILRTFPSTARRVRGAPHRARLARTYWRSMQMGLALKEAMDGRYRSRAFQGPLCCGAGRTKRPAGWAQWIAPTCRRAKDGASASPDGPHALFVHGWTKSAAPGWPFFGPPFFGHAKKGGSPAREAGEKRQGSRCSNRWNIKMDSGLRRNEDKRAALFHDVERGFALGPRLVRTITG